MLLDPATGSNFFGRRDILELLKKRVDGLRCGYRQNVAIIGPPYYGKTSIVCRFLDEMPFNDVIPVYIEVKPQGFSNFAEKFISTLLFKYLSNIEYKIEDTKELISIASDSMPKTVKAVKAVETLIKNGKVSKAYSAILELPALAHSETNRRPIIILDEFHRIADFGVEEAFAVLGKYIMLQKDMMYIVTSSQINQAKEILSEKLSLLFGNFEVCELETFDASTSTDFINSRLHSNTIPKQFSNFLVAFTGGHPFYLDSILHKLDDNLSAISKDNQIDAITKTLSEILFDSKGILNQHFANVVFELERLDQRYIPVLLAISNGNKKTQSIASHSRLTSKDLKALLDKLIDFGWVAKRGIFYLIGDKVFEFWLKNVHQSKEYLLVVDYKSKMSNFNQEIKNCISRFSDATCQHYLTLISDLFVSFNNELIEVDKRGFRFPAFNEARAENTKDEGISYLILSNTECSWVVLISTGLLKERNIIDFLNYCRQSNPAIKRKIVICLSEMDTNTKLLAKESKSLIWTLKELNELFDISGKERLILLDANKTEVSQALPDQNSNMETA